MAIKCRVVVAGGATMFLEIAGFLEILINSWKMFRLLLLVNIKVSNRIRKSLNLAPTTL